MSVTLEVSQSEMSASSSELLAPKNIWLMSVTLEVVQLEISEVK